MRKRSHITVVDGESPAPPYAEAEAEALELQDEVLELEQWEAAEPELVPTRGIGRLSAILAAITTLAWTGFYLFAHWDEMLAGASAQQWTAWVTSWAIPVVLIVCLWMVALRNSTAEAHRFGEIARSLAQESADLEARLVTVNRELSLAREFLASQSRDLEFLGRSAGERLSEHADRLQGLVRDNGEQVDAIATVSGTALDNMNRLRDNLPVIANSAKDVSNQIGSAGRTAQEQLERLVQGFERLNEFGAASERQVVTLQTRVNDAMDAFTGHADHLERIAAERFAALRDTSDEARAELDAREIEALAAIRARSEALRSELAEVQQTASAEEELALAGMRERIAALQSEAATASEGIRNAEQGALTAWRSQVDAMQERLAAAASEIQATDAAVLAAASERVAALKAHSDAVHQELEARGATFDEGARRRIADLDEVQAAITQELDARLSALDTAIAERRDAQLQQLALLAERGEEFGHRIAALGETFASVDEQGRLAGDNLATAIAGLNQQLLSSREALEGTDRSVAQLTDASVRLLELIQASARHSRDELPVAMKSSEERLEEIERRTGEIRTLLDRARSSGAELTEGMTDVERRTREAIASFEDFQSGFGETASAQIDSVERLRASLSGLRQESDQLAARVQGELREAIEALQSTARQALSALEDEDAARIARIADTVGERSGEAIDRVLAEHTDTALARLDEARERSTEAARDAARDLRDQLARLNELTGNLEARIAHARDKASDSVDADFARRVALITESLNSNAIDLSKALSSEVTDTAWASYLRGDRGIFTRRAVRLIDNGEARQIAELYDEDTDFREHVNRYIHDFEAMLRTLLSTRDGNALSVTLLSSDMGKLYVIMAQALERLRQ